MDQSGPSQEHRLERKALWAALWLAKLVHFMPDVLRLPRRVRAFIERRLDMLADFVINFVIIRAARQIRPGQRQRNRFTVWCASVRHDVRARQLQSLRAAIGGRLRCALKARGLKARAEAILYALQNLDRLTARFVRRMRQGLSRRMSARSRANGASCSACAEMLGAKFARLASMLAVEVRAAAPP
jgi:hypothetical protein